MATAAGMASLFSSSINTVKCLRSKNSSLDTSSNRMFVSLISQSSVEPLSIGTTVSHKLWFPRISVAVAQEEAVVAVEDEEKVVVEEEEKEEEEVVEEKENIGGETVAEVDTRTKLYFGNLPYSVDSALLAGLIEEYGSAELIEVLYDRDTGKSRGFAFVTMSCVEDCNAVIQNLDGKEFMGRTLRVNFSDKPKPKEPLYPETEYKLFVGNLAWTVTSESLTQAFQEHGTVVGARVLFDGETGKSRGYGFVSYATKSEMDTALAIMDNVELEGRTLRVSLAQGKRS
ncbi:28 kDa ribonucleoprotein, chloroplastic [Medicago truncatula]|uniref:RNA-binding (RRM/RBD/RNP motif) family protein n=1 Tax=Medicago truncatula TaxID=3880 RepID=G7I6P1_MEDTR|nr:28 kDa ribonucleoprotein, chloroplastic [Medicago truncatula]AES60425.2 RNA-binding (RRM/RBD/RNP motif) family protein [Medicago truncatula]